MFDSKMYFGSLTNLNKSSKNTLGVLYTCTLRSFFATKSSDLSASIKRQNLKMYTIFTTDFRLYVVITVSDLGMCVEMWNETFHYYKLHLFELHGKGRGRVRLFLRGVGSGQRSYNSYVIENPSLLLCSITASQTHVWMSLPCVISQYLEIP